MKIQELRTITGLSQGKFAKKFSIPLGTLRNWEQGIRKPPEYVLNLIERILLFENAIIMSLGSIKGDEIMFTAEQLSKLPLEELEKLVREAPIMKAPTLKEIENMNMGIYDENDKLIGDKEGDDD